MSVSSEDLAAIEEIKQLKARYCRTIDHKDWLGFRAVFLSDAVVDVPGVGPIEGADRFVEFVKERTARGKTVHQCMLPEITLLDETSATGIWAMVDLVERGDGELPEDGLPGFRGYGHYHDEYRRTSSGWRIASVRLVRLRLDRRDPQT